jgi:nitroreductase
MMDFFEAVEKRRSVRKYKPDPVPEKDLGQIVRAGIEAPSGCNMQLRQYVIVDDPETMAKIRPLSRALSGAPAAIAILVEPKETDYGSFWMQDASAAMENMLLAATALGYASCWIEGALRRCEDQLRDILQVPDSLRVWSLLPVGRADENPSRPEKSKYDDVVHRNRFGVSAST